MLRQESQGMALARNNRIDRRRQLLRMNAEAENDGASSTRSRRRPRMDDQEDIIPLKRDAGYSQAVRRACQHRLVQLIPVRRTSVAAVISVAWIAWGILIGLHYLLFVQGSDALRTLPIAHLFHLRSDHGISHWLGTQLWMLTALAALLIYQLRKHKLDDYRAKYRLWLLLMAAALFASLDSSTSILRLIGYSIDGWSRREMGYSGWAVVLATFAALIGVLGLRLCGELMNVPSAVTFWLGGLVSWGISALLGTGLIHSTWSPEYLDMVVGATWLGGILAVWLSAGMYLRHNYIQAQKRFLSRGTLLQPIKFQMPKLALLQWKRELNEGEEDEDGEEHVEKASGGISLKRFASMLKERKEERARAKAEALEIKQLRKEEARRESEERAQAKATKTNASARPTRESDGDDEDQTSTSSASTSKSSKWFGFGKKNGSTAASDEQESSSPTHKKDVEPLAKLKRDDSAGSKRWWPMGRKGETASEEGDTKPTKSSKTAASKSENETAAERKSWFQRKPKTETAKESTTERSKSSEGSEKSIPLGTKSWFKRSVQGQEAKDTSTAKSTEASPKEKRSWFAKRTGDASAEKATKPEPKATDGKKGGLFGFLDGLKLKPPADGESRPAKSSGGRDLPSTMPDDGSDPEDRSDLYDRQMSKAERKKMRREQGNQRRAA